jgi:hypothetical protein
MGGWVVVYSDDRELDVLGINYQRERQVRSGKLKLLKTGTGKVPTATALAGYLSSSLRTGSRTQPPQVISVGLAQTSEWTFVGQTVTPWSAIDRDMTPSELTARGIEPFPLVKLDSPLVQQGIASGDSMNVTSAEVTRFRERDIHLFDVDSHAVGWVSIRCLAGRAKSVRFVTHEVGTTPKSWEKTYVQACKELTAQVLQLTAEGTDA